MELEVLPFDLTVCKVRSQSDLPLNAPLFFVGKTDRELSLVCRTEDTPQSVTAREDGWRGFRIGGTLDFALVGVLSRITGVLANGGISVFAVSTFDTDYVLVKAKKLAEALDTLTANGFTVVESENA